MHHNNLNLIYAKTILDRFDCSVGTIVERMWSFNRWLLPLSCHFRV